LYRSLSTTSTASWSAEEACTRRRKAREPLDERSRISSRRRGLRCGITFETCDRGSSDVVQLGVSLSWELCVGWDGGNAEDCGVGGAGADVEDIV
jgi:hypothetical protein